MRGELFDGVIEVADLLGAVFDAFALVLLILGFGKLHGEIVGNLSGVRHREQNP